MTRPFVQEFANYILGTAQPPRPILKTEANCAQVHLYKQFKPMWSNRVPYGYVLLYPDWLAFFTDSKQPPGTVPDKLFSKEMLAPMLETWKYSGRFQTVGSVARFAYQYATTTERDTIKAFLANPNSTFVPFGTIWTVEQTRSISRPVAIEIKTTDRREIHLAPNFGASLGPRLWKGMYGAYGGTWEPRLQSFLRDAAQRNSGRVS
ncbi:hypothetical protein SAMN04244553_2542 [Nocardia amikacinitolerans]|uniref:Uncharacterized protein n=1 Tax=Nocardia amikacinitolerans TaxID=756689 RepID=A0A285LBI6_9NOCA|nr:hypothetical protein [Nocardia amikacinitolerans]SNY80966.1 hypothetical protein SAMN04244553_2542 [Nocardia amikacinitolerans]